MANLVHNEAQLEQKKYKAFISYSHADKAAAKWLHTFLEAYRVPKNLVGKKTSVGITPQRLTPIFRDQDELPASGDLGKELQNALNNSEFLIVICSPNAAKSKWVNEEIRQFKLMHGESLVLALIVNGEPNTDGNNTEQECFPAALKYQIQDNGELSDIACEPIAADIRKNADTKRLACLKLISGLTGLKLDDLVQRDSARHIRKLAQISIASVLAAVFSVSLAIYANDQRVEANKQRVIAEQESKNARAVSDFLVESFSSGSSVNKNPNDITARSIFDDGVARITVELNGQPKVQSRLSSTIGLAYNNLGLFNESIELIDSIIGVSGVETTLVYQVKADALLRLGKLDEANNALKYARVLTEKVAIDELSGSEKQRILTQRTELARSQAYLFYKLGEHQQSLDMYALALETLQSMPETNKEVLASVLQNRSFLYSDIGDLEAANKDLEQAKSYTIESVGEDDILMGNILLAQAQVNFLKWELDLALQHINLALVNIERILEQDNPSLADAFSLKGQILHAMGDLDNAQKALTDAVDLYDKAYNGPHYLTGIAEIYLALIAGDKKEYTRSLVHFDEAQKHYDAGYGKLHANHGDLMVNRATVLVQAGEIEQAKQDCVNGMQILFDTLGEQAAFTQQLQAVCDDIYAQQ